MLNTITVQDYLLSGGVLACLIPDAYKVVTALGEEIGLVNDGIEIFEGENRVHSPLRYPHPIVARIETQAVTTL